MSKTIQVWSKGRLSQYETPRDNHVVRGTLLPIDIRTGSDCALKGRFALEAQGLKEVWRYDHTAKYALVISKKCHVRGAGHRDPKGQPSSPETKVATLHGGDASNR
jgi:hypothetical protein